MNKNIYRLPGDFFKGNPAETNFHFYQIQKSTEKNKINFSQNLLCLLLEGKKEIYYAGAFSQINCTTLFLLPKGNTLMTEKISGPKNFKTILIFFSDNFLADLLIKNDLKMPKRKKANNALCILEKDEFIYNFEKSLLLLNEGELIEEKLRNIKTEEILLYLYHKNHNEVTCFLQKALDDNHYSEFRNLIQNHLYHHLTVAELAFLSNMSLSSFKRKFSEIFNTSPKQYFLKAKMEKARQELLRNKRPSEFFYHLGYENLSSFSNEFKKHFGASPKNFIGKN